MVVAVVLDDELPFAVVEVGAGQEVAAAVVEIDLGCGAR